MMYHLVVWFKSINMGDLINKYYIQMDLQEHLKGTHGIYTQRCREIPYLLPLKILLVTNGCIRIWPLKGLAATWKLKKIHSLGKSKKFKEMYKSLAFVKVPMAGSWEVFHHFRFFTTGIPELNS